jgi:GNAT superfamily N-acetyltransferase
MTPLNETSILHDPSLVRALHQAYADKTESFFAGLQRAPGDPCRVRIRTFGSTRTFIAHGHDWLNRVTLVGDETFEQLDEIIAYFAGHGQRCQVEWNPGNCYRPDSWNDELGRRLLDRGFRPGGFRCVWVVRTAAAADEPPVETPPVSIRHFAAGELEEFLAVLGVMERHTDEQRARSRLNVMHGEGDARWRHYVGYVDDVPCCNATLFAGPRVAYLEWVQTLAAFRGRGCHHALIRRRLADAAAAGCELAFAVTDVGTQSARNLQRAGFRLAYNYVMLTREPQPIG